MKAFRVFYQTAGRSTSAVVLTEDESTLETSLSEKDSDFEIGDRYSRISNKREMPLSNVMLRDLSVAELLKLMNKE
ncbi:hypothetical protein [Bacillus cereus group sp. BcHK140]|uniref:hypothetical protein n=1 Tax=Bacillus cereus group sp. BcHK140 TaxID=3018092 RepID=UPI0022E2815E|nr:hypothetical protein [Bacillus cereus group sp. BcHK140]MDA1918225.1 hypothetical protein [Bacillus cereus group sp. BcHK140]